MNEALYDLHYGLEMYYTLMWVGIAWLILSTLTAMYAVWYKWNCNVPDSSINDVEEGTKLNIIRLNSSDALRSLSGLRVNRMTEPEGMLGK